jgi:hypothetical protein
MQGRLRGALVAGILAIALALPASSGAYLRAFQSTTDIEVAPSSNSPRANATLCNSSKFVLGTGANAGPLAELGIYDLGAETTQIGYGFSGVQEQDPTDAQWSMNTTATCVEATGTPPTAPTGADYVKAVKVVSSRTRFNSNPKLRSAVCPAGDTALAGGAAIKVGGGDNRGIAFDRLYPSQSDRWTAGAQENDPTGKDWRLAVKAVCANVSTYTNTPDYAGLGGIFTFTESAVNSKPVKRVKHTCGPQLRAVGGGARTYTEAGIGNAPAEVALTRSQPVDLKRGTAKAWAAEARELDPTAARWGLRVAVFCMPLGYFPNDD